MDASKEVYGLLKEGRELRDSGNYEGALDSFQRAYQEASEPQGFFSGRKHPIPNKSLGEGKAVKALREIRKELGILYGGLEKPGESASDNESISVEGIKKGYSKPNQNQLLRERTSRALDNVDHTIGSSQTRKQKSFGGLEGQVVNGFASVLVVAGLFLLSPNITGNAIGSLTDTSSNFMGIGLIILGIVLGVLSFRNK